MFVLSIDDRDNSEEGGDDHVDRDRDGHDDYLFTTLTFIFVRWEDKLVYIYNGDEFAESFLDMKIPRNQPVER